jgi:hypothetical protein
MAVTIKINPCPSGTVDVEKSDGNLIAAVTVAAGAVAAYQVADSPVTVNAAAFANVKATESQEVPVQYPDNTATGTISSGVVRINNNRFNIASAWKTGQTTSYAANDDGARQQGAGAAFGTLSENNPFGNTNRFTDTLGGQTYANDIVVDWADVDYVNKTVGMWYRVIQGGAGVTWAVAMAAQPVTVAGYNDWYLPNEQQLHDVANIGVSTGPLNYTPFNINTTTGFSGQGVWTSSTNIADTVNAFRCPSASTLSATARGSRIANLGKTTPANYILYRRATFAELGITNY